MHYSVWKSFRILRQLYARFLYWKRSAVDLNIPKYYSFLFRDFFYMELLMSFQTKQIVVRKG